MASSRDIQRSFWTVCLLFDFFFISLLTVRDCSAGDLMRSSCFRLYASDDSQLNNTQLPAFLERFPGHDFSAAAARKSYSVDLVGSQVLSAIFYTCAPTEFCRPSSSQRSSARKERHTAAAPPPRRLRRLRPRARFRSRPRRRDGDGRRPARRAVARAFIKPRDEDSCARRAVASSPQTSIGTNHGPAPMHREPAEQPRAPARAVFRRVDALEPHAEEESQAIRGPRGPRRGRSDVRALGPPRGGRRAPSEAARHRVNRRARRGPHGRRGRVQGN